MKILVFKTRIVFTLLYANESWTLYSRQEKRLNAFYMRCLRTILSITWRDKVTNLEKLRWANVPSLYEILRRNRLRWLSHISWMSDERLPKKVLYGELSEGNRRVGRPKLRYKDTCKSTLQAFHINHQNWETAAADRLLWREKIRSGMNKLSEDMVRRDQQRRERRLWARDQPPNEDFPCRYCGRLCRANIGRISHERACARIGNNV